MAGNDQPLPLLELPDPCLLAVLRCCAADSPQSLFSAARAHSRLHQVAVGVLGNVQTVLSQQQRADSILQYLEKRGQGLSSIALTGEGLDSHSSEEPITLQQLPYSSFHGLASLSLCRLRVSIQPRQADPVRCVSLTQLRISECTLLGGEQALAAALSLLPGLRHLSICDTCWSSEEGSNFPTDTLQALTQLSVLQLEDCDLDPVGQQQLQRLTRLQELRLRPGSSSTTITASMLKALQQLTCLHLRSRGYARVELKPAALSGLTQLQHLALLGCDIAGSPGGVAQLLSHLQPLQQLTYLEVFSSMREVATPTAAFSALTASSKLQQLHIGHNILPAGVWQHMFPAGRRLPQLQVLDFNSSNAGNGPAVVPEGSRLVSCCPGLQTLVVHCLHYSPELLAPLSGLTGLHELGAFSPYMSDVAQVLQAVYHLSTLQRLTLPNIPALTTSEDLVVQMSQLQHLTWLKYFPKNRGNGIVFTSEAPGDEPVWRQVLQYHSNPPCDSDSAESESGSEVESDPELESGSELESDPE